MRYTIGIALLIGIIVGALAGGRVSSPATAQDTTEDRVSALETLVADQETRLDAIEERLDALEGIEREGGEAAAAPSGKAVTVSGVGGVVSEDFQLAAGRYEVTAAVEVAEFDGFAAYVYSPGGQEELLFNEVIDQPGQWTGSVIFEASETGSYFVEAQNTGSPWVLTFEPR